MTIEQLITIVEQIKNIKLRKVQKQAIKEAVKGNFIELPTGSGKTLVILVVASYFALQDRNVFLVFPNDYLCERDFMYAQDYLSILKIPSSLQKTQTLKKGITFGVDSAFVFEHLSNKEQNKDVVIIDEADYTLIENGTSTLSVSSKFTKKVDYDYVKFAVDLFDSLDGGEKELDSHIQFLKEKHVDYIYTVDTFYFTERGLERILSVYNNSEFLNFMNIVGYSLKNLKLDVHYKIVDNEIFIINNYSKRKTKSSKFASEIQTILEYYNHIPLSRNTGLNYTMTYPLYFSKFKEVIGFSGTLKEYSLEIFEFFKKNIKQFKFSNNTKIHTDKIFETKEARNRYLSSLLKSDLPILIISENDTEVDFLVEYIKKYTSKAILVFSNNNLADEYMIVNSVQKDTIIVTTPLIGRGTDIKNDCFLIVLGKNQFKAVDRQIIGRVGRNNYHGEVQFLITLEDEIFKKNTLSSLKNPFSIIKHNQAKNSVINSSLAIETFNLNKKIDSYIEKIKENCILYNPNVNRQLLLETFDMIILPFIHNIKLQYEYSFRTQQENSNQLIDTLLLEKENLIDDFNSLLKFYLSNAKMLNLGEM